MDEELDLVVFRDDDGNEITMQVLDYFFYEGDDEYALLTDFVEDESPCADCEGEACEGCDNRKEVYVMKVVPVGEDEEEFVPVDEELAQKIIDAIQAEDDDDYFFEDEEDE